MSEREADSERDCRVGVVIPAAGAGARMGGVRKAFLELAGRPTLEHSLRPFLSEPRVVSVVVVLAPDDVASPPSWLASLDPRVAVAAGGATRTESVRRGIAALPEDVDIIAIHDAARPLVSSEAVSACVDVAMEGMGAVAGCPAVDTMKRVDAEDRVVETPEREALWHAHTPQVFPSDALRQAYADEGFEGTDDAALAERTGLEVQMVDGGRWNIKITHPSDVRVAEAILAGRKEGLE